ncbi:MAG: caspase family protein [Planctomycetia bacterium]|nr:caspase family protein [Planctomycetia bacterium]
MKKHALLVGINEYPHLGDLNYAERDAEAVAEALRKFYEFAPHEVTLMTSQRACPPLDSAAIEDMINTQCLGEDLDLLIFGFWGHGVWKDGTRYLCPMNQRPGQIERFGVSLDDVRRRLVRIHPKNVCIILDCCQSVAKGRGLAEENMAPGETRRMEQMARDIQMSVEKEAPFSPTVAILNACSEGQKAYEWQDRGHGIFSAHLIDALAQPLDRISLVFEQLSERVAQTAAQMQVAQTPYYFCEKGSDIRLPVRKTPTEETQAALVPESTQEKPLPKRLYQLFPGLSVEELRSLRAVDWSQRGVRWRDLELLKSLTQLESLDLSGARTEFGLYLRGELKILSSLTRLKRLALNGANLTNKELSYLEGLPLEELYLEGNPELTDDGIVAIRSLETLSTLHLDCTNLTNAGLRHLYPLSRLRTLRLIQDVGFFTWLRDAVTSAGVEELRRRLPGCNVVHEMI